MLSTDRTRWLTTKNPPIDTHSNNNINILFRSFSPDYNGPIIFTESTDENQNLKNLNPFKISKIFSTNFSWHHQCQSSPTHVGRLNSADSAIDLSFCSPGLTWKLSWSTLSETHGSDHIPITIKANFSNIMHFNLSFSKDFFIKYSIFYLFKIFFYSFKIFLFIHIYWHFSQIYYFLINVDFFLCDMMPILF